MPSVSKNKTSVNVSIDKDLLEKSRNMIYWMPGLAFSRYIEDLISEDVIKYEKKHGPIEKDTSRYL